MTTSFDELPAETPSLWWRFLRYHYSTLLFLILASVGMLAAYIYFNPNSSGIDALDNSPFFQPTLSIPMSKPVGSQTVRQRFSQTAPPLNFVIIVGHRNSDSGAVCEDGLTELAINTTLAEKVLLNLTARGYHVTLFDEFDTRLDGYEGIGVLSIHADSCGDFGPEATGYKTAGSSFTDSSVLERCVNDAYQAATGLSVHENTITTHMTDYHAFRQLAVGTPAVILETGFMRADRELLTINSDIPARGISDGIV